VVRPVPTQVLHFTHVSHLETIMREGLLSDTVASLADLPRTEIGDQDIKAMRRRRSVLASPGGVVADYVPFYYAPRSPMMLLIHSGRVPTYTAGCDDLVYLVTTVERLAELGRPLVFTDRNAVLKITKFSTAISELDSLIDWPLMRARMWHNTESQPDRKERRMAECLVHERVPWVAFVEVVARTVACARRTRAAVATVGGNIPVVVRRGWYF
jgi:ssDNA thymidine ADP-ribosyltransferase, DarT